MKLRIEFNAVLQCILFILRITSFVGSMVGRPRNLNRKDSNFGCSSLSSIMVIPCLAKNEIAHCKFLEYNGLLQCILFTIAARYLTVLWLLIVLVVYRTCHANNGTTSTLDYILHGGYERKLRPNSGGPAIEVDLGVEVESLNSISASTMDFSLTIFLREYWTDPRFASINATSRTILKGNYIDLVWIPDIFFINEKSAKMHDVTVSNKLINIKPNGSIWMSLRVSLTIGCQMGLQYFPMDSQKCRLEMRSYAYDMEEMKLTLPKENVFIPDDIKVPRFEYKEMMVAEEEHDFKTGNFSKCVIVFTFKRQMQAYLLTVYIPSVLLVSIAWLSFWIDAKAAPARVSLGITTVLTVTTMTSGILETLPVVTYAKAIDIWLAACLLFVFMSLLEFAWANYLTFNEARRIKKRKSMKLTEKRNAGEKHNADMDVSSDMIELEYFLGEKHLTALKLDKISRVVFPICFLLFNLIYWPYYLYVGDLQLAFSDIFKKKA